MTIAPNPVSPYRSVDIHGRALPMTEEEILERNAEAIRASMRSPRWATKRSNAPPSRR